MMKDKYMGGGYMVRYMQKQMKKKMKEPRGGYAKGGKAGYSSISDMEKHCGSKTVKNTMR